MLGPWNGNWVPGGRGAAAEVSASSQDQGPEGLVLPLPAMDDEELAMLARWKQMMQIEKQKKEKLWQWVIEMQQVQFQQD